MPDITREFLQEMITVAERFDDEATSPDLPDWDSVEVIIHQLADLCRAHLDMMQECERVKARLAEIERWIPLTEEYPDPDKESWKIFTMLFKTK